MRISTKNVEKAKEEANKKKVAKEKLKDSGMKLEKLVAILVEKGILTEEDF